MNIHLIDTNKTPSFDILPCIECWCQNLTQAAAENYYGGTACCKPLNCQSALSAPDTTKTTYYLQFNITYR